MASYYRDPDAPTPNRALKVGVCLVVEMDGGVLIDRRRDDGAWAFTGETLEDGESVSDALARELLEETGLEVDCAAPLGVFSDPSRIVEYPDGSVYRVLSLAFVVTPQPGTEPRASDESLELSVLSADQLRELPIWPAHRPIRDAYLSFDGAVIVE
jgi:ADP-ribose pyrophosphatase YjhB (NUDIX family)